MTVNGTIFYGGNDPDFYESIRVAGIKVELRDEDEEDDVLNKLSPFVAYVPDLGTSLCDRERTAPLPDDC